MAKIKTYSLQTEPFLHVDGDVYISRPLPVPEGCDTKYKSIKVSEKIRGRPKKAKVMNELKE